MYLKVLTHSLYGVMLDDEEKTFYGAFLCMLKPSSNDFIITFTSLFHPRRGQWVGIFSPF
jgi:hypothetical protein